MVDRHVVTKQRAPSIKEIIKRIEDLLAAEATEKGKTQLEKSLGYWKGRKKAKNVIS